MKAVFTICAAVGRSLRRCNNQLSGFRGHFRFAVTSVALLLGLLLASTPASATVFVFDQMAASIPGLSFNASITINGDFSNLPTLTSHSNPINFGSLLAFDISSPIGHFALGDFTSPSLPFFDFPDWTISPSGIVFVSSDDSSDFRITGFGTDSIIGGATESGGPCFHTGACVATGTWVPIPEPPTSFILVSALFLAALLGEARDRTEHRLSE